MPVLVSCSGIAKTYDLRPLFNGLDLGIASGDRLGLIGPNGSGKSTLLRILAGSLAPDEGTRAIAGGTRMAFVAQRDDLAAGATPTGVLDAALATARPNLDEHERAVRVRIALDGAGFTGEQARPDQDVATLSGGWRKRLAIASGLIAEPDLLLLDEPTNHLDLEGIWWLERLLAGSRGTVGLVSHDRFFLERVCTRVFELNRLYPGGGFGSEGGYSAFLEKRAEFLANQKHQEAVLDNRVRREIEWMRRNPAAQTRKSKARLDQADDLINHLGELRWRNSQDRKVGIDFTASGRRTNDLVVLDGVAGEAGGRRLFSEVSLTLSPGTRLGVLGGNGSGKTTLLRILARQQAPAAGTVKHAHELKVVVFDQKREQLDPSLPLRRALCPTGQTVVYRGRSQHVAAWAKRFLFTPFQLDQEVGKLSGGEQARVLIANLMLREADLLILDEPTNDLDIPSLEVLEESLCDFPGAIALVTHDRYLLDRVATTILALDGEGGAWQVADCAQWEDLDERLESRRRAQAAADAPPPHPPAPRFAGGLENRERRELDKLPQRIEQAEAQVATVEARLADPAVATDPAALKQACQDLATAQAEVERLYQRWSDLEAKRTQAG